MDYFDREDDMAFSDLVRRFNDPSTDEKEKIRLEAGIKERTSVLLYLIPRRNLFLDEADISGFYLDVIRDIDRIIGSFTISGTSYNAYIREICRYRSFRYLRDRERKEFVEKALVYSEVRNSDLWSTDRSALSEGRTWYSDNRNGRKISSMDLKEVSSYIITHRGRMKLKDKKEKILYERLSDPMMRTRFLSFLLSIPGDENDATVTGLSRILGSDIQAVDRLIFLRKEEVEKLSEKEHKARDLAARYWRIMTKIQASIQREEDPDKKREFTDAYNRIQRLFEERKKDAANGRKGLTQEMISKVLSRSRSSVSNDIRYIRTLLESLTKLE